VVLRKLFERLGSTYVKLGQFIASSPSLFPDEYVLEFQKCLDKTEAVPYSAIQPIIEAELGRPLGEVFSSVDPVPLASASVAQVHTATLKSSNKQVVIKVLKPGVEDILSTDMSFVYLMSKYLEFIQPELARLSLTAIMGDIRTSMLEEVDFNKEADHIQQFSTFLDTRGFRGVATCPYVYRQFSSKRILVMERLVGAPLVDYAAIRSITSKDPEAVLVSALNTWFASVMGADTFHADVHAGNLLVLGDGRVGFLDFGIVGRISPVTWKAVEALVTSLALADYETMARALATIGACDVDVDYSK
ncbi:ABC1 domain-containing protein, partial [Haematococcus lacustris]